jgi:hypothetical protein
MADGKDGKDPKGTQQRMVGDGLPPFDEEIEALARDYELKRNRRMDNGKEEKEAKSKLLTKLLEKGIKDYPFDDGQAHAVIENGTPNVKVTRSKAPKGEDE